MSKGKVGFLLEYEIDEEFVKDVASSRLYHARKFYGDIFLKCLGYNASCIDVYRCRSDELSINIAYSVGEDIEYIKTFLISEIIQSVKGKSVDITYEMEIEEF